MTLVACGNSADEGDPDGAAATDGATATNATPAAGVPCTETFNHAGHQGCESVVEGQRVKFFPLDAGRSVRNLAVYLHGDGANGWFGNWAFDQTILQWANANDVLVLGLLATSSYDGSTDPAFGAAAHAQAEEVADAIETFILAYGASPDRTYYYSVSGGSFFVPGVFIPHVGHRVPGIFVANCGGSNVWATWQWGPQMDTTTRDKIAVHQGATHCNHDIMGPTLDFWKRHD